MAIKTELGGDVVSKRPNEQTKLQLQAHCRHFGHEGNSLTTPQTLIKKESLCHSQTLTQAAL